MPTKPRRSRRKTFAASAAALLGAAVVPEAAAAVITVNSTADNPIDDSQCTLREALTNANDDAVTFIDCAGGSGADTIQFSLTLPATINIGVELFISDDVTIDGPGAQSDLIIDANSASRIFEISDDNPVNNIAVEINDLTLTNGNATVEIFPAGGAILNVEDLTIDNVLLSFNQAQAGGAISNAGDLLLAELTVADSTFSGNTAAYAGAIFSYGTNVDIDNTTLTGNTAYAFGGAILQTYGDFTLTDSSVTDNTAAVSGGIALYYAGAVTITNSTISGNDATAGDAGGLYIYGTLTSVTIEDSVISGNTAANNAAGVKIAQGPEAPVYIRDTEISGNIAGNSTGGLYLYATGRATLERVKLIDNSATNYQGGGAFWYVTADVIESQITGNQAAVAGGLYAAYGTYLYMVNSTVANNTATSGSVGGLGINGAYAFIDVSTISGNSAPTGAAGNMFVYGSNLYMSNSIIADGTALTGPDLVTSNSNVDINYSLIEDTSTATFTGSNNLTGVEAQLGPLQNNGGPTETVKPALTSPAVNSGDPAFVFPPNDQRGFTRPIGRVDMGAVELNPGVLALETDGYIVNEADGILTVTVTRTGGSDGAVSVNYFTTSGTAFGGVDYTAVNGTLNWADNDSAPKTFDIPITNDTIFEGNEQFTVALQSPVGATLGTSSASVTIVDNDPQPAISIDSPSAPEGTGGSSNLTFTVSLSNPSTQTITVNYGTIGGSADTPGDYGATSGMLTFNPGVTSLPINVPIVTDALDEGDETVQMQLTSPTNATFANTIGIGTILDDDPTPTVSIGDSSLIEGTGGAFPMPFQVTLSAPSSLGIIVSYNTAPGTAGLTDFVSDSGVVSFDPGETSKTINIFITGDPDDEPNEAFTVVLSNPNAAVTIGDGSATGTIIDDDGAPSIQINDVSLAEGNAGTTNFVFDVTLSNISGQTVSVAFNTAGVSATSGIDFLPNSGTLTFVPGDTSEQVTVQVVGETAGELDETFNFVLSNPTNATIGDDTGTGTIINDDAIADLSVTKIAGSGPFLAGGNATFNITVTNAGPSSATNVTVTDILPPGTSYVSATPSAGLCSGTATVTCNVGTLAANGSATITLVVQLNTPGPKTNTATAASDATDLTPAAGAATITVNATTAVPALSEWMLMALASALAAIAAMKVKR